MYLHTPKHDLKAIKTTRLTRHMLRQAKADKGKKEKERKKKKKKKKKKKQIARS